TDFSQSSNPTGTPSATFAGTSLGAGSLISTLSGTDPVTLGPYTWRAFTWNVTSLVTGNGNYSASGTGFSSPSLYGSYGMALVVGFSPSSLPNGTVLVNDGIGDLSPGHQGPDSESTSFAAPAGSYRLWVHAVGDNVAGENNLPGDQTDERIKFSGEVVGGPIDHSLGRYATLISLNVLATGGTTAREGTTRG